MMRMCFAVALVLSGCSHQPGASASSGQADVTAAVATGAAGDYSFAVTVSSPDTGCALYADWWEVVSSDGNLLYRRILAHSHVDEQPFTRSGGPVSIQPDDEVVVRAHLNQGGYGGQLLRGSVSGGFDVDTSLATGFASDLATQPPLPDGCAF